MIGLQACRRERNTAYVVMSALALFQFSSRPSFSAPDSTYKVKHDFVLPDASNRTKELSSLYSRITRLSSEGKLAEAEPFTHRYVELLEAAPTSSNEFMKHVYIAYSRMLASLGRKDEAKVYGVKAFTISRKIFGGRSPTLVNKGIVGVKFAIQPGAHPIVKDVFDGGPAASAGICIDDEIISVDGVSMDYLTEPEVWDAVVGPPNTIVEITVLRDGQHQHTFKCLRASVDTLKDASVKTAYPKSTPE